MYFAKINKENIVETIIVADQAFIDSGKVGDKSLWIETCIEGKIRKNYAKIGIAYNKDKDAFISAKPFVSWVLNEEKAKWEAPTKSLVADKAEKWNEVDKKWEEYKTIEIIKEIIK